MGMDASVRVFYGCCFDAESEEAARFVRDEDAEDARPEDAGRGGPAWLYGCGEPFGGVEVVLFGHADDPGIGLAVSGTVRKGRDWDPLSLPSDLGIPLPEAAAAVQEYQKEWGLPPAAIGWWAVPYYG